MRSRFFSALYQSAVAHCAVNPHSSGTSATQSESFASAATPKCDRDISSQTTIPDTMPASQSGASAGQIHHATAGMPAFVQSCPEFYRKYDRSWDDQYQANAMIVVRALTSMSEASSSFQHFRDSVENKVDTLRHRGAMKATWLGPLDESFSGPSTLFNLLREKCPFAVDNSRIKPNYDFLLFVAEYGKTVHSVFPFSEVSSDLVLSVHSQEHCIDQAVPLTSKLRHTLSSIGSECKALRKQIMSTELRSQYAIFELISSQEFKDVLRGHLTELEKMVATYVKMINDMYVFPMLKYGKYSGYLRRTNCLVANQFSAITSMIECFLSLMLEIHDPSGSRVVDPSFGRSLSKLSVDLFIRLTGCNSDYKKLLAQKPGYVTRILLWTRSLSRCVRKSTREMDCLWERLSALPEKMSHVNPFARNTSSELSRLIDEVESLKIEVKGSRINANMSMPEIRLKLDELDELSAVLKKLQDGRMDGLLEICAPPTVESIENALDCIFQVTEELVLMPRALTKSRIGDLQSTLEHQSIRLDHTKDRDLPASDVETLRRSIDLLGARLKGLEQATTEVGIDVFVAVFIGSVLAMCSVVYFLRKTCC